MSNSTYTAAMAKWQTERLNSLRNPEGYLSLVGLYWLKDGVNRIGSASTNDCIFPEGMPAYMGTVTVSDGTFHLALAEGVEAFIDGNPVREATLLADMDTDGPTIVRHGTVNWFVIRRGTALGIRVRDTHSETLRSFEGVERYPVDEAWRISAEFLPHDQPITVPIPTILGTPADMVSPGKVRLSVNGHTQEMTALKAGNGQQLFLIVADSTSGQETYGGGRFLTTEAVDDANQVIVDFNKATNPPCAFTPYATCPRPPAENRLPFPVTAGEKAFHYTI